MNPIKDIKDVIDHWDVFEDAWSSRIFAFLLYTDEDRNLAAFIRENFKNLDELSGCTCLIFLIDEPCADWKREAQAREYWNEFEFREYVWGGFLQSRPYDRSKAYRAADYLGVPPDAMPCLAFFKDIRDDQMAVYSFDPQASVDELSVVFRNIFTIVSKAAKKAEQQINGSSKDDAARKRDLAWCEVASFVAMDKAKGHLTSVLQNPIVKSIGDALKKIAATFVG